MRVFPHFALLLVGAVWTAFARTVSAAVAIVENNTPIHLIPPDQAFVVHIPTFIWSQPDLLRPLLDNLVALHSLVFWSASGEHSYVCSRAPSKSPRQDSPKTASVRLERNLAESPSQSLPLRLSPHLPHHKFSQSLPGELINASLTLDRETSYDSDSDLHHPQVNGAHSPHLQTVPGVFHRRSSLIARSVAPLSSSVLSELFANNAQVVPLHPHSPPRGGRAFAKPFLTLVSMDHVGAQGRARVNQVLKILSEDASVIAIDATQKHKVHNTFAVRALFGASQSHLSETIMPHDSGVGEIVTVGDSGLDINHCFFKPKGGADPPKYTYTLNEPLPQIHPDSTSKVLGYVSMSFSDGATKYHSDFEDEPNGHGTHVSGSAVGGLLPSMDSCGGFAAQEDRSNSGAQILMLDFGNANVSREFLLIPPSLEPLFQISYQAGSRIHSASWGSNSPRYTFQSEEFDDFIYQNDEYVAVIANGNDGRHGLYTVGSPATAKNVISVGAATNSYDAWLASTSDVFWEDRSTWINASHVAQAPVLYNEDWIADFSSKGPTSDNRTKPDIVAPGRLVLSSRSKGKNSSDLLWMQGTSMATPIVTRMVSLIRSRLRNFKGISHPSAALVKGILIHGAQSVRYGVTTLRWGDGGSKARNYVQTPTASEFEQGWGRVHMAPFFQDAVGWKDRLTIRGFDEPQKRCFQASVSGQAHIVLVWTDPPGNVPRDSREAGHRVLVNDLDLRVLVWPEGANDTSTPQSVLLGNMGTLPDRRNNVEKVSFAVQQGDTVRVVVSTAGIIQTPLETFLYAPETAGLQLYTLVWSSDVLTETHTGCQSQCVMWDPEYECAAPLPNGVLGFLSLQTPAGAPAAQSSREAGLAIAVKDAEALSIVGVRPCERDSGRYALEPSSPSSLQCLPVQIPEGEMVIELCSPGLAFDTTNNSCVCYAHIPCADPEQHFAFCSEDHVLSPCATLVGSIFSDTLDVPPFLQEQPALGVQACGTSPKVDRQLFVAGFLCLAFTLFLWVTIMEIVDIEVKRATLNGVAFKVIHDNKHTS